MKISQKITHWSLLCLSLALMLFFVIASGGCGGSASAPGVGDGGGSAVPEESSATKAETTFSISDLSTLLGMDMDNNGMPDFLDFYGVAQLHVDNINSSSASSVKISEAPQIMAAVEKSVSVPSMIWLNQLRLASEDANLFSVNLEAGQEYTLEFSKNLTESLGGVLPSVKFYDPANSQLSIEEAEPMENVTISPYPVEHPSILCYTIKPAVSGNYLVEIANGEPTTNEDADDIDTASVLFIYKERRNEKGETGYYTNFKFEDDNGNKTETLSVEELIYLRQLFLEAYPEYFNEAYGQNLPDDEYGTNCGFALPYLDDADYATAMYKIQALLGILVIDEEELENDPEDAEYELEPLTDVASYLGKKVVISSKANVGASAIEDQNSQIDTHITGLPYEPEYSIGRGFMATSNFGPIMPQGGIEVDIDNVWNKSNQSYLKNTEDYLPLQTESYAKFVNTSMQAESLLKTSTTVGMSTAAVGTSMGSGTTNNLKFGLTSTNLVIHYEEVENGYRRINAKKLAKAWREQGEDGENDLFDFVAGLGKRYGKDRFKEMFRNNLGDYYVSGYQYGACYDAYISIRTETSEQTRELEKKLSASLNLGEGDDQLNISSDIKSKLTDTLKEYEATIEVKIVTNGLGNGKPTLYPMGDVASNDIKALDKVGESLTNFLSQLRSNNDRRNYSPVRVKLTRWRNNFTMAQTMMEAGDEDGLIPVKVGQMSRIAGFNTGLKNLTGYKNVVGDNPNIPSSAMADIEKEYNEIVAVVKAGGERFYASSDDVKRYQTRIDAITPKYKALADRYAFYTMLVRAQAAEKKVYEKLLAGSKSSDTGSEQSRKFVRQMPFGASEGKSSSGFSDFPYSTYVTEDIKAGGPEQHKQYYKENNSNAFRRFWYETQKEGDDEYLASAGPAILNASSVSGDNAVFCKITVTSLSRNRDTDNLRELTRGSPAVGTRTVGFNFQSGRGDHVDWNIYGQSMRMRPEDYPFKGLEN